MKVQVGIPESRNPVRKCISPDGDYYWEGGKLKIDYLDIGRLCLQQQPVAVTTRIITWFLRKTGYL